MSKKPNRFCKVCGVPFYGCDNCYEFKTFEPHKTLCDTNQHYQVYLIISELRGGVMNSQEAKESLIHIGITVDEIKTFVHAVQELLLPIMEEKPKANVEVIFVEEDDESDEES